MKQLYVPRDFHVLSDEAMEFLLGDSSFLMAQGRAVEVVCDEAVSTVSELHN